MSLLQRSLTMHRWLGVLTKPLNKLGRLSTSASICRQPVKRFAERKFMFVAGLFPLNYFAGGIVAHKNPPVILYLCVLL